MDSSMRRQSVIPPYIMKMMYSTSRDSLKRSMSSPTLRLFGQVVLRPAWLGTYPELYGDRTERQCAVLRLAQQRQITWSGFQS
jgi:hypothetical protein